jgi:hypothetical protein
MLRGDDREICEEDFESLTAGLGEVRLPVIQNTSKDAT